mmetsp:Transcript_16083/g.30384  ORF Transcript_16083/g.30384 Transcript_16083/m.30384 type:complete len:245 (+) Transcript_16083:192-926(+)
MSSNWAVHNKRLYMYGFSPPMQQTNIFRRSFLLAQMLEMLIPTRTQIHQSHFGPNQTEALRLPSSSGTTIATGTSPAAALPRTEPFADKLHARHESLPRLGRDLMLVVEVLDRAPDRATRGPRLGRDLMLFVEVRDGLPGGLGRGLRLDRDLILLVEVLHGRGDALRRRLDHPEDSADRPRFGLGGDPVVLVDLLATVVVSGHGFGWSAVGVNIICLDFLLDGSSRILESIYLRLYRVSSLLLL